MGAGARVYLLIGIASAVVTLAMLGADLAGAEERVASVRVPVRHPSGTVNESTVTVTGGDHLWKIARAHLEKVMVDEPSRRQIAGYWRSLILLNVGALRSGDPNLIFPGEVIALPPIPVSGPP